MTQHLLPLPNPWFMALLFKGVEYSPHPHRYHSSCITGKKIPKAFIRSPFRPQAIYDNKRARGSVILPGHSYSTEPLATHSQKKEGIEKATRAAQQWPAPVLPRSPLRAFRSNSHYWVDIVAQEQHGLNIVKNPHRVREWVCKRERGGKTDRKKGSEKKGNMLGTRKADFSWTVSQHCK